MKKLLVLFGLVALSPSSFSGTAGEDQIIQQFKRDGLRKPLSDYVGWHSARPMDIPDYFGNGRIDYLLLERNFLPTTMVNGKPLMNVVYRVSYYNYQGQPIRTLDTYTVNCKVENDVVWRRFLDLMENRAKEIGDKESSVYARMIWRAACGN